MTGSTGTTHLDGRKQTYIIVNSKFESNVPVKVTHLKAWYPVWQYTHTNGGAGGGRLRTQQTHDITIQVQLQDIV
jgi:hypothetical protein